MRYMIIISTDDDARRQWDADPAVFEDAHRAVFAELEASGELVDGNELDPDDTTVIGTWRGIRISSRGPFTEGTEVLGGYYIVDVADRERAVEIAGKLAETRFSPVEIRRLMH
ncbi:YciI family protein [Homoserinibacter sp. YIM 151385]|uniref:YciI family protein n=1 Tax=Homoserinibacter sp. YIM 151385 TaxID=2985506 RepID=UPI0022F02653|nr:YciI family protein [Homoserinibacter sp. YIM 151385]WBU38185.1 YciI family protein [Homoserinibacter sp. YIM 151385]